MGTRTIKTTLNPKPIPIRRFDWEARREDYCCPECDRIGYGETEQEAIEELLEAEDLRNEARGFVGGEPLRH